MKKTKTPIIALLVIIAIALIGILFFVGKDYIDEWLIQREIHQDYVNSEYYIMDQKTDTDKDNKFNEIYAGAYTGNYYSDDWGDLYVHADNDRVMTLSGQAIEDVYGDYEITIALSAYETEDNPWAIAYDDINSFKWEFDGWDDINKFDRSVTIRISFDGSSEYVCFQQY